MTKSDLFKVSIKLIAIYCFINFLFIYFFNSVVSLCFTPFVDSNIANTLILVLITFLYVVIFFGLFLFLVKKTDYIVNRFKLDKGYDDDLVRLDKIEAIQILEVGIIIVGLASCISPMPNLLYNLFLKIKNSVSPDMFYVANNYDWQYLVKDTLHLLLGVLLVSNYKAVARFLYKSNELNDVKRDSDEV